MVCNPTDRGYVDSRLHAHDDDFRQGILEWMIPTITTINLGPLASLLMEEHGDWLGGAAAALPKVGAVCTLELAMTICAYAS